VTIGPGRLVRALLLLALGGALIAADEPVLVPEVSQDEVRLQYGFSGAELLLFGAVIYPGGRLPSGDIDVAVVLKGEPRSIILREKQQIAGIWVNAASTEFRSAPAFYSVASSRPLDRIIDDRTAAIYELGLDWLQLSPATAIDPAEQRRFARGLVDLNRRQGLYSESGNSIKISEAVLYQARIQIPASVPEGTYTAETFLIQDGRVVAAAAREIEIAKFGAERFIAQQAEDDSLVYGLCAVALSLLLGWAAGTLFQRLQD